MADTRAFTLDGDTEASEREVVQTEGPIDEVEVTAGQASQTPAVVSAAPPAPLLWGFISVVVAAPLPFGLVTPLSQAVFFFAVVLCTLATAAWCVDRGGLPVSLRRLRVEAVLFLGLIAWVLVQQLPFQNLAHPVWQDAGARLGVHNSPRIALAPDLTWEALLRLLGYAALFWTALQLGRDRAAALRIFVALAVAAVSFAAYGLIIHLGGFRLILWYETSRSDANVIATFVNRNNYATYAGLGLLVCAGLLGGRLGSTGRGHGRDAMVRLLRRFFADGMLLLGAMLVVFTALLLSASRGGFGAALVALFALAAFGLLRSTRRTGGRLGALLLAALPLPFVFGLSGEQLLGRLLDTDVDREARLSAFSAALRAIGDAPWVGFGYGGFRDAFQLYRDPSIVGWFDRLHNDWLEAVFGLGLPAALLLFLLLTSLTLRCLIGGFRRHRDGFYALVAVAASVLVAVHALSDFSLQLPAVTATWLVLLGVGFAQSWRTGG